MLGRYLTHLDSATEVEQLLYYCCDTLSAGVKLLLSFRDYTTELLDNEHFIPVKNDEIRILTCFLEYFPEKVGLIDLLYEKILTGWKQSLSSYEKIRLKPAFVRNCLTKSGLEIIFDGTVNRMVTVIAIKE
ncbi:hypothetical protein [uncultured Mucilaginibacter sp.]|uniref:hypothetical protein n=1 Tax=uncultured Mucilaginibacter sp. TaxID=797541 RepID=UPI0025D6B026|nr:hypothetical protein [uncultured Mucilaginibacter sp.]